MDKKPTHHNADFEVRASQNWASRNVNKGDVIHFKRGIAPNNGDIVAIGNPYDSDTIQLHVYDGTQPTIAGVCVAVTRTEGLNDDSRYRRGCPDMQTALQDLWRAGADNLTDDDLKWFKGFTDTAQEKAEELSKTLLNIGCTVMNDKDSGSFMDVRNVASLLFVITEQVTTIATMIEMGSNAAYRLENPQYFKNGGV